MRVYSALVCMILSAVLAAVSFAGPRDGIVGEVSDALPGALPTSTGFGTPPNPDPSPDPDPGPGPGELTPCERDCLDAYLAAVAAADAAHAAAVAAAAAARAAALAAAWDAYILMLALCDPEDPFCPLTAQQLYDAEVEAANRAYNKAVGQANRAHWQAVSAAAAALEACRDACDDEPGVQ